MKEPTFCQKSQLVKLAKKLRKSQLLRTNLDPKLVKNSHFLGQRWYIDPHITYPPLRTYTHPSEQFSATIYASRDYLNFQLHETSTYNYSSRESITSNSQETSSTGDNKTSDSELGCSENQLSTPASNHEHMEIVPGNVWLGDSNIMAQDSSSNKEHQAPSCHQQNTNDNLYQMKAKYKDVPKDVLRSRKRYRNEVRYELVAGYSERDTMVVIDNSNIFIGARETACAANSKLRHRHIKVRLRD